MPADFHLVICVGHYLNAVEVSGYKPEQETVGDLTMLLLSHHQKAFEYVDEQGLEEVVLLIEDHMAEEFGLEHRLF